LPKSETESTRPASAARFYTTDTDGSGNLKKFYAVSVIDADATANQTHDWSYSLVPETYLTDKFVVGWGPGADNVTRSFASTDLNASPVWVTPTENTVLYIDSATVTMRDSAGNPVAKTQDGSTGTYKYNVSRLQSYRLFDADKDQTALTVYTKDGTLITAAWGEDPSIAGAGTPYLDMGTTITPFPDYVLGKVAGETSTTAVAGASNDNTDIELGEQVTYTVSLTNRAVIDLYDIVLKDTITPAGSAEYIANSTVVTVYSPEGKKAWTIAGTTQTFYDADGVTVRNTVTNNGLAGSAFPLDGSGYRIADLDPSTTPVDGLERGGVVEVTYRVKIRDTINKSLADSDYTVTNSVTMTGTGVVKDKVNEAIIDVGPVTDGEVFFMDSGFTKTMSTYIGGTDTIGLRVADADQNRNASAADTVKVRVTNTSTGEYETLTLTETGNATGVFTATLGTTSSASAGGNDSGNINLTVGNSLKVEYADARSLGQPTATPSDSDLFNSANWTAGIDNPSNWGITSSTYTSGSNNNLKLATGMSAPPPPSTDGKVEFFNAGYTNAAINYAEADTLYIQVTDADQNTSTSSAQSLTVTVRNSTTGEIENVTLTETGVNTGIFRGSLVTAAAAAAAASNNGTLRMSTGQSVQVDYSDPVTGSSFDSPSNPGITSPYNTGNANRDTFTVLKIKSLYLSSTGDLDRIDPVKAIDNSTTSTGALAPSAGNTSVYYRDQFSSTSYSNDHSSGVSWSTSWREDENADGTIDSTQSASSGSVQINSGVLRFEEKNNNDEPKIFRSVDLSSADATQAITLSFDIAADSLGNTGSNEKVTLEISTDGGTTYNPITIGSLSGVNGTIFFGRLLNNSNANPGSFVGDDTATATYSADIRSIIASAANPSDVRVRFNANALSGSAYFTVDDFKIAFNAIASSTSESFTQTIPMATSISLPASGVVNVTTHISAESGLSSGTYAGITAALTYTPSGGGADVTIATLGSATYSELKYAPGLWAIGINHKGWVVA
jgi:uncharacterized repeat protein (TIGR01451 family)